MRTACELPLWVALFANPSAIKLEEENENSLSPHLFLLITSVKQNKDVLYGRSHPHHHAYERHWIICRKWGYRNHKSHFNLLKVKPPHWPRCCGHFRLWEAKNTAQKALNLGVGWVKLLRNGRRGVYIKKTKQKKKHEVIMLWIKLVHIKNILYLKRILRKKGRRVFFLKKQPIPLHLHVTIIKG